MNRISNISTPTDFALEKEREVLRDRRSTRRNRRLLVWAKLAGSAAGLGLFFFHLLPILQGTL
jgi:hypothetical protein